jgi:hypothetical protein
MPDASEPISLLDLLAHLLTDHVPQEVAFQEAQHRHSKGSMFIGDVVEGDPPIWKRTSWDTAVRWLARKSEFLNGIDPADSIDQDPIGTYERLLREFLAEAKGGGPTQSNPAAAELLEFEKQGLAMHLYRELKPNLPEYVDGQLAVVGEAERPVGAGEQSAEKRIIGGKHADAPAQGDANKPRGIQRPSEKVFKAWRLRDLTGINNQTELAAKLNEQGVPATQGQVSRWLKEVDEYLRAGNSLPPLDALPAKPQSIDPEIIELGERQDGRTVRQRERRGAESNDR